MAETLKVILTYIPAVSAVIGLSVGILIIDYPKVIFSDFDKGNDESTSNDRRQYSTPGIQKRDSSGVAARGCQLPLQAYFDRLRLWYRIASLDDELIGPTIAGRLYGRAHRVAMSLRVPRPDGSFDTGDAALVRLEVDEVRDPATGMLLQSHIPSGVQFLTSALRSAFGQQDQYLATQSLERFFNLTRGNL